MGEDPLPVQRPLDQTKERQECSHIVRNKLHATHLQNNMRRSRRDELINLIPLENRGEVEQVQP